MQSTATKTVESLAPQAGVYTDLTSFVAEYLGREVAANRATETIEYSVMRVLAKHGVEISTAAAERINDLVMGDVVLDSEALMATRAVGRVLHETFGSKMQVSGWIDGRRLFKNHDLFVLIDEACPECEVNPLAHGVGGGVRCLNTRECGYWFCF